MKKESWIEIAREGSFKDSSGAAQHFNADRLEKIAASYDPKKREAPLMIGHPTTNGPAFGWVRALKKVGDKLLANLACVSDEIKAAVDNGYYKHVSMSLYQDGGLRHIGLLGATPPAINGLTPASFSDAAAVTINFNSEEERRGEEMSIEELTRQLGELQKKLDAATEERDAARKEADELKAALEKNASETEKTEAEFASYRDKNEREILRKRFDDLVKDGRLTPAERPAAEKTAEALRASNYNFSDSEEKPLDTFINSLEQRPRSALLCEFAAPAEQNTDASVSAESIIKKL